MKNFLLRNIKRVQITLFFIMALLVFLFLVLSYSTETDDETANVSTPTNNTVIIQETNVQKAEEHTDVQENITTTISSATQEAEEFADAGANATTQITDAIQEVEEYPAEKISDSPVTVPEATEEYPAEKIYADILFFEGRVDSDEKTLFYQNYRSIGDAILDACPVYFPDLPLKHCGRIFVATTLKESTFNKYEIHETESEYPTLGLLQIRKSSTVEDYYKYGNTDYLRERTIFFEDPTDEQMQNILYNIHLGMWYISVHARGNARYTKEYCAGEISETGTIAVGLSSHRIGPTAYQEGSRLETAQSYVDWIKTKYLELFVNEGSVPDADYFSKQLIYLSSLCAIPQ